MNREERRRQKRTEKKVNRVWLKDSEMTKRHLVPGGIPDWGRIAERLAEVIQEAWVRGVTALRLVTFQEIVQDLVFGRLPPQIRSLLVEWREKGCSLEVQSYEGSLDHVHECSKITNGELPVCMWFRAPSKGRKVDCVVTFGDPDCQNAAQLLAEIHGRAQSELGRT